MPGSGHFHAQWRREQPKAMSDQGLLNEVYEFGGLNVDGKENYTILEAEGHGHYVGCLFSVYNLRRSPFWDWYGEGDDMIFVDGEPGFAAPDARRESNVPGEPTGASIAPRPESAPGANNAWPPTLHGTGPRIISTAPGARPRSITLPIMASSPVAARIGPTR